MPVRRGDKNKTKQKKAITTRLMEISLKLDDYIYKKKPISAADAQAYISEISTYKTQCFKDERSLQVIEKLSRCMKSIVHEEQNGDDGEQQQNISTKNNAQSCPSPTYSLVEEDIDHAAYNQDIQDTQVTLQQKAVETHAEQPSIDTINLCDEENNERRPTADIEMHRALSNLSIRDEDQLSTADVCSQSILDNFEMLNQNSSLLVEDRDHHTIEKAQIVLFPAMKVTTSTATPSHDDGTMPHITIQRYKYNKNEIRMDKSFKTNIKFVDLTEDENPYENKELSAKKIVRFVTNVNKEANVPVIAKEHNKNFTKKDTKIINNNFKSKLKNQDNNKTKKKPKRQVNKQKKTNKQINFISKDTILPKKIATLNSHNPNSTVSTKTCTAKTSCGTTYNTTLISKNVQEPITEGKSVHKAEKHCISKIYSNNTANDLSWMENIRFVREIEKEEVDTNLTGLNASFWEDLSFPNDWGAHEFDV